MPLDGGGSGGGERATATTLARADGLACPIIADIAPARVVAVVVAPFIPLLAPVPTLFPTAVSPPAYWPPLLAAPRASSEDDAME